MAFEAMMAEGTPEGVVNEPKADEHDQGENAVYHVPTIRRHLLKIGNYHRHMCEDLIHGNHPEFMSEALYLFGLRWRVVGYLNSEFTFVSFSGKTAGDDLAKADALMVGNFR